MTSQNDAEQVHRMTAALFQEVLAQPEPAPPQVLDEVRRGGRRLRRRRRLAVGAGALAVLALCGTGAVVAVGSRPTSVGPAAGGAGGPVRQDGMDQFDKLHDRMLAALRASLPAGYVNVVDGSGPTTFELVREDGGTVAVAAVMGNPLPAGTYPRSPCDAAGPAGQAYFVDCRSVTLPDGSTGWLSKGTTNPVTGVTLATPQGRVFGLGGVPSGGGHDVGPAPLDDLEALVRAPQVAAVLQGVPMDAPS
ncbi:hypothetical protein OG535_02985 [Kitasatospora sp. NBC_00085]|uniref:hypothetical protein n=1 Tax=Kitasatospora sp. NBC_00085 TaxID=2903566 RepID=UPI0032461933